MEPITQPKVHETTWSLHELIGQGLGYNSHQNFVGFD